MKYLVCSMLVVVSTSSAIASELSIRIKAEAQACANAVIGADYDTLVRYTHPRIVTLMGGKEQMISVVSAGMSQMQSQGITLVSATVGDAEEPRSVGDLMVSMVPQTIVMKSPEAKIRQESSLLGISEDGGATWVFLDVGPVSEAQFRRIFPELADAIVLPPKKRPIVEEI